MKKFFYFFAINLLLPIILAANINTRLVLVSNSPNSPSAGKGTMIIRVQAISNSGSELISAFQDAFELDNTFRNQNPVVTFSNQLFPSSDYTTTESYNNSNGAVRYAYTFDSGSRLSVLTSYTDVVTINLVYDLDQTKETTISWTGALPNYLVTDENNQNVTGSEEAIPASLQNLPLPVELTSFYSMVTDTKVKLFWETATEVQNKGFEIERTHDAEEKDWESLGFIEGHGNSNSPKKYSFEDKILTEVINFITD